MAKVDIYSGFLGAGKTTLIKKLLEDGYDNEKVVLIENEFGEIGIDSGFLADAGINITEMNSGCICCTLVGDFAVALEKVIKEFNPDRILIEPSGVGKLSDVAEAVMDVEGCDIASMVTVVDARKCRMYHKNFGEFFNNQIESAGTVVLSHTDSADDDTLKTALDIVRELNDEANLVTSPWDELTGEQILAEFAPGKQVEHHHHHDHDHEHEHHHHDHDHDHEHHHHHHHDGEHDADEVFDSIGIETVKTFDKAELEKVLAGFEDEESVLRAKGMVKGTDGWLFFDYVPGKVDVREGSVQVTGKVVVIGTEIEEEDIEWFRGILDRCGNCKGAIFDIGTGVLKDYELFLLFDVVVVPYLTGEKELAKKERFEQLLNLYGMEHLRDSFYFINMEKEEEVAAGKKELFDA